MKIKYFLLIGGLISTLYSAKAQIFAGFHSATDIYFEFNPSLNFYADDPDDKPYHGVPSDLDSVSLDINQDDLPDFVIYAGYTNGDKWFQDYQLSARPLNGNRLSLSHVDSCFSFQDPPQFRYASPVLNSFVAGMKIDRYCHWTDSLLFVSYSRSEADYTDCSHLYFSDEMSYAGIQIIKNQDTTYGWIHLKANDYDSCLIFEYAYNPVVNSNIPDETRNRIILFPNPSVGLSLLSIKEEGQFPVLIQIFNLQGSLIQEIIPVKQPVIIDLSGQPAGVYLIKTTFTKYIYLNKLIIN